MSKEKTDIEQQPQAAEPEQPAAPEDPLAALTAERDELQERLLRLAADTENYKKRSEREKAEFLKRANEALLKDLLPVLDNLERALEHADGPEGDPSLMEGLGLIHQELFKVLERYGLEPVAALGQPFNPEVHEAMMQQEDLEHADGTVINEMQKGYLLHGRLLRPAMVVVSKRPADSDDEGEQIKIKVH